MPVSTKLPPGGVDEASWVSMAVSQRALLVARQEAELYGTCEIAAHSHRGPRVDAMLRAASSYPGQPWEAALVSWCLSHAGWRPQENGLTYPGSVGAWVAWARGAGRVVDRPVCGDLGFIERAGEPSLFFVLFAGSSGSQIRTIGVVDGAVDTQVRPASDATGFISLRGLRSRL